MASSRTSIDYTKSTTISVKSQNGATKPKVYVTLVLDSTGSMAGSRMTSALEGAQEIAKVLMSQCSDPGMKLGHFNSGLPKKPTILVSKEVSRIDWGKVKGQVRCGGQTPLYDTIVNTISTMEYGKKYKGIHRLCVILTDGEDNVSTATWQDTRDKIADPGPINRSGKFHFLLFGAGISRHRERELELLCKDVDHATYHRVEDAEKIKEALSTEISKRIQLIVVQEVRLEIDGDDLKHDYLDDVISGVANMSLLGDSLKLESTKGRGSGNRGRGRGRGGRGRGGRGRGGRGRGGRGRGRGGRGRGSAGRGRGKQPCHFFRQGKCKNGAACKFSHDL